MADVNVHVGSYGDEQRSDVEVQALVDNNPEVNQLLLCFCNKVVIVYEIIVCLDRLSLKTTYNFVNSHRCSR